MAETASEGCQTSRRRGSHLEVLKLPPGQNYSFSLHASVRWMLNYALEGWCLPPNLSGPDEDQAAEAEPFWPKLLEKLYQKASGASFEP